MGDVKGLAYDITSRDDGVLLKPPKHTTKQGLWRSHTILLCFTVHSLEESVWCLHFYSFVNFFVDIYLKGYT